MLNENLRKQRERNRRNYCYCKTYCQTPSNGQTDTTDT